MNANPHMSHLKKMGTCENIVVPGGSIQHCGLSLGCWVRTWKLSCFILKGGYFERLLCALKSHRPGSDSVVWPGNLFNSSVPTPSPAWLLHWLLWDCWGFCS